MDLFVKYLEIWNVAESIGISLSFWFLCHHHSLSRSSFASVQSKVSNLKFHHFQFSQLLFLSLTNIDHVTILLSSSVGIDARLTLCSLHCFSPHYIAERVTIKRISRIEWLSVLLRSINRLVHWLPLSTCLLGKRYWFSVYVLLCFENGCFVEMLEILVEIWKNDCCWKFWCFCRISTRSL